jgi:hypothetical protein
MTYNSTVGAFMIFKVKSGVITHETNDEEYFPTDQQNGVMCSAHFSNYPDKDALVTARYYDGQITIFTMDGLCPNLYLNNPNTLPIDNPFTGINNNYSIDYHANNTLYANNFNEASGNDVEFVAGNKIIVTPGANGSAAYSGSSFHAYIDNVHLGCGNNSTFKIAPATTPPQYNNQVSTVVKKDSITKSKDTLKNISFTVLPNPNNGNMNVSYEIPKNETGVMEIYNTLGTKLHSYPLIAGKNTFAINGDNLNTGIYLYRATAGNKIIAKDKIVVIK